MSGKGKRPAEVVIQYDAGALDMISRLWGVYLGMPISEKSVEDMLAMVAMARGVKVRPLESLPVPSPVREFWRVVEEAEANGAALNRSGAFGEIALRMPMVGEVLVRAGWSAADVRAVRKLLPLYSPNRLLRKNVAMRDGISGGTIRCWIFQRNSEEV